MTDGVPQLRYYPISLIPILFYDELRVIPTIVRG